MNQLNEPLSLATAQMYQVPALEAYENDKRAYLLTLDPNYANKTLREQWSFVMDALIPLIPQEFVRVDFRTFRDERMRGALDPNPNRLSLAQCLLYFADFLFILGTKNSLYRLNAQQKRDLCRDIHSGLHVCEPGLNTTLYTAVQKYLRVGHWVLNQLSVLRCNVITRLYTGCIAANPGIDVGYYVHVNDALTQLANQQNFGIMQRVVIHDIYMAAQFGYQAISRNFWAQHGALAFAEYERQAPMNLTQHVMNDVLVLSLDLNTVAWYAGPVPINRDQINALGAALTNGFGDLANGVMHELVTEDYASLQARGDCERIIFRLVQALLVEQGYILTIERLNNLQNAENIVLRYGLTAAELLKTHQALLAHDRRSLRQRACMQVLQHYPEVFLYHLQRDFRVLACIPGRYWDDISPDHVVFVALRRLLEQGPADDFRAACVFFLRVISDNRTVLLHLHADFFQNQVFAEAMIQHNPLWFDLIHPSIQEACSHRLPENSLAHYYRQPMLTLGDRYASVYMQVPLSLQTNRQHFVPHETVNDRHLFALQEQIALLTLATSAQVPPVDFLRSIKVLSPMQLCALIEYRQRQQMSTLPWCESPDCVVYLRWFYALVNRQAGVDWAQGHQAVRRALLHRDGVWALVENHPAMLVLKNQQWMSGFIQYQIILEQAAVDVLFRRSIAIVGAVFCLLYSLLLALFFGMVSLVAASAFFLVPVPVVISLGVTNSFLVYLSCFTYPMVILFSFLLKELFFYSMFFEQMFSVICWPLLLLEPIINHCAYFGEQTFIHLSIFLDLPCLLVDTMSFLWSVSVAPIGTIEEQCHRVWARLALMSDVSAQKKADLLKQLEEQMQNDPEGSYAERVQKAYPVVYAGGVHQLSFAQVASIARTAEQDFSLTEPTFFKRVCKIRTRSDVMLSSAVPRVA